MVRGGDLDRRDLHGSDRSFQWKVFEGDFERLAGFIDEAGFFDWGDRYEFDVTDNPEYELVVIRDGVKKGVVQYATDDPPGFWTIATLIDGIASQIDWTKEETS